MRRAVRVFLIAVLVAIIALIVYSGWQRKGPNQFEAAFNPGGKIALDLATGGYNIKGTTDNNIRVVLDSGEARYVRCQMQVSGTQAKVQIEGPSNNFHATIYVPQRSDLQVDQTIGEVIVSNVEGNKKIGLGIGRVQVDVPTTEPLPSLDGSVTIGDVRANNWRVEKGGFFRSFYARSNAPYSIAAHVDIGEVDIAETSPKMDSSHPYQSGDADQDVSDQDSENDAQ